MKKLIILIITVLIIGSIVSYFIISNLTKKPNNFHPRGEFNLNDNPDRNFSNRPGNFEMNEEIKSEIISFFNNTEDLNKINFYCEENRMNCIYYCIEINSNQEICDNINLPMKK